MVFSTSRLTSGWPLVKPAVGSPAELIGTNSIAVILALPVIVTRA